MNPGYFVAFMEPCFNVRMDDSCRFFGSSVQPFGLKLLEVYKRKPTEAMSFAELFINRNASRTINVSINWPGYDGLVSVGNSTKKFPKKATVSDIVYECALLVCKYMAEVKRKIIPARGTDSHKYDMIRNDISFEDVFLGGFRWTGEGNNYELILFCPKITSQATN